MPPALRFSDAPSVVARLRGAAERPATRFSGAPWHPINLHQAPRVLSRPEPRPVIGAGRAGNAYRVRSFDA